MEEHRHLTDAQFEERFANLQFVPSHFTHEAHLRLAWIHVTRYGVEKAVENVCTQIKAMTMHLGIGEKYHATVTEAAVRAVYHFTLKSESDNFPDFINRFPQLKTEFKALLDSHYSIDIFQSAEARQHFQQPDMEPFD